MSAKADPRELLSDLIRHARTLGADAADALLVEGAALSHAQRMGRIEKLERQESQDLGLRVLIGKRQAMVSGAVLDRATLHALAERAVAMARVVPEDEFCGLADPSQIATSFPTIDLDDPVEPASETLIARAKAAEESALAVKGITNSEGAEASWGRSRVTLEASNGFFGSYARSSQSISVSVIAGEGTAMERDYDWHSAVYGADLEDPATLGRRAAEKAIKRLNPRRPKTAKLPVVYDPRVSNSMIGHFLGAINGAAIARGTSFLRDQLGKDVFGQHVSIVEDPHRQRGQRSRPFDAEGIATQKYDLVRNGALTTWLLDLRSARQLQLKSTGHAGRGTSGPPSPSASNVYLAAGSKTPAGLIGEIEQGIYVTELIGFGVNGITGDYSRGAGGFWIEKGQLTHPINEITVAGNLKDMFKALTPANDLNFRYGTDAPTLRIDGMTIAGA
ncbi:MAG: TldD/PmbA family protein [Alphaproteobacteria bacterium]